MTGVRALSAEIIVGLDQTTPEIRLPDPVDPHPGRKRVPAIHEPAGKVLTVWWRPWVRAHKSRKDPRYAGCHRLAFPCKVTSLVHMCDPRAPGPLFNHH